MKLAHNVRVRVTDKDKNLVKEILDRVLRDANIERKDVELLVTSDQDPEDPLFIGELWMDHQPPVRKIIKLLQIKLSSQDKDSIATKPLQHLDTSTHCFIKLNKAQFTQNNYVLAPSGSVVHFRLNIAAFPANKENAAILLSEIFSK